MRANLENAKQLMLDGDRLLAEGSRRLEPTGGIPTDLDFVDAAHCLDLARDAYLQGAIEHQRYQRGAESVTGDPVPPSRLFDELEGHLGLEARVAREEAKKLPKSTAQAAALQAQAFAENVRDRFARALPQLFNQASDTPRNQSSRHAWSR